MNACLSKLARTADGRFFSNDERQSFLTYADTLPRRIRAAEAVEQKEEEVVRNVVEQTQKRYPNFAKFHDQAWARQFRDIQLVVRADAQAMILDNVERLDDKRLYWLRTMSAANSYTPQ